MSGPKDVLVEVQFARFEVDPRGTAQLDARVGLHFSGAEERWSLRRFTTETNAGSSTSSHVRGLSVALEQLSTFIAEVIASGPADLD
jgi:hypothetical protein